MPFKSPLPQRLLSPTVIRPLAAVASLLAFGLALWVIHREASVITWDEIHAGLRRVGGTDVLFGLALAAGSYLALTGFDYMGLRHCGMRLPYRQVLPGAFIAQAISHTAGFAALTGTSIRLRFYSNLGVGPLDVARVMVFCTISIALGAAVVGAAGAVAEPVRLAAALQLPLPVVKLIGVALLLAVGAYIGAASLRTAVAVRGWRLPLPALRVTLAQVALSTLDWMAAGGVLYILLPENLPVSLAGFLGLYAIAIMAGVVSHVPGGVGVFEGLLLVFLPGVPAADVLTAMILYRLIYNVLPLVVAVTLLVGIELAQKRAAAQSTLRRVAGVSRRLTPPAFAVLTVVAGLVMLVSSATPAAPGRLDMLSTVLPLGVVEASHVLGSIAGLLCLVLARGLLRRLDSAWLGVLALALGSAVLSLLKGWDWEEATLMTLLAVLLWLARPVFNRHGSLLHQPLTPGWLAAVGVALAASLWLGWFTWSHGEYAAYDLWTFAFEAEAPRALRATVLAAGVALVLLAMHFAGPAAPRPTVATAAEVTEAAAIVARAGDSAACLALLGDKSFLFSPERDAFLMYGASGRSLVAMGDPVGNPAAAADLVWSFRELCDRTASWPVFYQIRAETLPLYLDLGLRFVKLGEEAVVPLAGFSLEGKPRADLRYCHRRAVKEGATFEVVPPGAAGALMDDLARVSQAWLEERRAREKRFSLGRFDPDYLARFPIAVARRDGQVVAFANLWPAGDRRELTVDLMRHLPGGGYGIMDFLFVEIMLWAKAEGWETFSLGMAPLAGLPDNPLAPVWGRVGAMIFERGEGFYNFQGIRRYKEKFQPQWRPRFLAAPGGPVLLKVAMDVAGLIGGGFRGVITK
ncbi:bifunctional lysylphosphatidylglycerol flippase/synthetase MprF [Caenispirillum bisanense]|uniref:bifunctional lysylphosphatidylglycerol flippase/synthetase MprF n=1 Tax=Caenispirillum bisanense TaxID=414052 RepID=UPI0031DE69C9